MKRIALALIVTAVLIGCADPAGTEAPDGNHFVYNGTAYDLDAMYLEDGWANETGGGYAIDLWMVSDSVSFDAASDQLTGTGDIVLLSLNVSERATIEGGTYQYDETEDPGTVRYVVAGVGRNIDTSEGTATFFASGSATISGDGGTYDIEFDFSDGGNDLSGQFIGAVSEVF